MKEVIMRTFCKIMLVLVAFSLSACQTKQDGALEGMVTPANSNAKITALQAGKPVSAVDANIQDGKFRMALAPGMYDISVTAPAAPFPMSFPGIRIEPGKTITLPPVELAPATGKANLSGKVFPVVPNSQVKLIYEGKERAAVHTDPEGKYEFTELPAGTYVLQASAPGHAEDAAQVVVAENQKAEQNAVLFPITTIDGVDWAAGKIRSTGVGIPPQNAANSTVRHAMAQRAALADAQRNMLRTIEQIRLDDKHDVKTAMRRKDFSEKIQGFLKGYAVISERESADGKIEVVLELPLTGPAGLTRYVTE
jgi:hypothetical protein